MTQGRQASNKAAVSTLSSNQNICVPVLTLTSQTTAKGTACLKTHMIVHNEALATVQEVSLALRRDIVFDLVVHQLDARGEYAGPGLLPCLDQVGARQDSQGNHICARATLLQDFDDFYYSARQYKGCVSLPQLPLGHHSDSVE